jgi:hypothetical protein
MAHRPLVSVGNAANNGPARRYGWLSGSEKAFEMPESRTNKSPSRPGITAALDALALPDSSALVVPTMDHLSPDNTIREELLRQVKRTGAQVLVVVQDANETTRGIELPGARASPTTAVSRNDKPAVAVPRPSRRDCRPVVRPAALDISPGPVAPVNHTTYPHAAISATNKPTPNANG